MEKQLLLRIDHPSIVRILGAGTIPRPFLILEKLKDISALLDLQADGDIRPSALIRKRPFTYRELLLHAKSFAEAMEYLHASVHPSAMILHRDLKPENLGIIFIRFTFT